MEKLKLFSREQVGNAPLTGRQYSRPDSLSLVSRQSVLAFLLVLLTTVFGVGNAWAAEELKATIDFASNDFEIPTSKTTAENTYTYDGISMTLVGTSGNGYAYYSKDKYLLNGKEGATITFSAFTWKTTKIVVTGRSGASGSTKMNIFVGEEAASTETTGSTGTNTYNIAADKQAAGTIYTLKVTSAHNAQFTKFEIYGEDAGTPAKTLTSIAVSGTPTKTAYYAGDEFDPAGLTVKGTYDDSSVEDITSGITWTYNPSQTLVKDQTSIGVIATVSEIASAEYNVTGLTVTEASPKITITQNEVADFAASYAEYTWTAGGVSGKMYAYKNAGMQFNPGKTGYYVYNTDPIPGRITKITMTKASGTDRSWTPYVSTTAMTSASGTALDAQTVTTSGASWDVTGSNSYFYLTVSGGATVIGSIVIEYTEEAAPAVDAPSISGDVNFVGSTTVTISHEDADHIYYTTNGDNPTTSSTEYLAPFTVDADGTTTVKAIAVKGSDVSDPATKTFTKVEALESLAALLEATTSTETAFNVVISNWVVTGVNGSRAWIADAANEKGILLYKSGHGFTAGKKLNGVVIGTKTKLFQGYPELTSLVSSDVTVTAAEAITPRTTTIAALTSGYNKEQGTVVKLENLTYTASVLSDGVNSIEADNKLFSSLALVEGTTYNITGVVEYLDGSVVKIMPRSADDVEAQSPVVIPTAANLAALKAAEKGTYILTLTNAVISYVNGKNAFIEDATAGALIFIQDHGYSAGDCLNGDYQVTTLDFQGKFEITAMEPQAGAATTTAEIPLTTVSIATLNADFAAYESKRIKIAGANVTDAISGSDRNGAINDGAALAVYASVTNTITLTVNDNVDIIGYPGFHNTDEQLTVWRQEDITVNVKEDPELAYNPAVVNVLLSDLASFTPADLEYATGFDGLAAITYESSDPSIATVGETTGVVEVVATAEGSATITASFPGNATYKVDNASYTINVSATPITPVYTMSFDMTRASYDAAADAQVVWNSSVVTMTVDKGTSSTKANNYIGGGYNGTTLCADSRFYPGSIITFAPASGVTITKVEWTATSNSYASNFVSATWTNAAATADGTKVTIVPSASGDFSAEVAASKQTRATAVTVYYEAESEKSKLAASISIDDINTAVGEDDIVLLNIAATSNPNKNAISYAITSGTAVSLVGEGKAAAFHALAEGTATITATIPNDLGNYTGATTTFNIVVAAAPPTLESIAISGEASVLEYTAGQHFNPAGLVVTGTYSDASTAPITEGIDWTFAPDPLTEGTTSVSVTATVGEISSAAVVVNGLTVSAAPVPTSGNIVILAEYNSKFYAMSNSLGNGALAGVEVEKDGSKIVVSSAEDKAAIQWTATVDGANTTLKDADDYYITGSSGASLSLEADPYNWNWDGEKSCYISSAYTNRGLFFNSANNVFKGYALSNITGDGYAATEVIEIDPENIVISSKVDPELAYTPASDEITVGGTWSAPVLGYVEGFDGSTTITYESSNEAVATVSDAGVIALAGGTGTATITATFGGNTNYLAGSATYTVKVNEPAEDCDGTDDFSTATNTSASSYNVERTTTNGWSSVNSALTTINSEARWLTMLGKTSQVGVITSPTLSDGIASLKIRYANTFNESNGVSFRVDIKQGEDIVKTYTITKENSEVEKGTVYTEIIENINVAGDFQMIFTNLCPSNADSNKDRVSIGRLCWTGYSAPTPVYETVRENLAADHYYTLCFNRKMNAVQGATFWSLASRDANMAYLVKEDAPYEAGKPYIIYAETAGDLTAVLEGDAEQNAGFNGALHGTFSEMDQADLDDAGENIYLLMNNQLRLVSNQMGNTLPAYRAYINIDQLSNNGVPAGVPAHRVRAIPMQQNTATGMENVQGDNVQCTKVMINGQLFILRGEKMYDVTGKLMK